MLFKCDIEDKSKRRYRCTLSTHGWYTIHQWVVSDKASAHGHVKDLGLHYAGDIEADPDNEIYPTDVRKPKHCHSYGNEDRFTLEDSSNVYV